MIISLKRADGGIFGRAVDEAGSPVKRFSITFTSEHGMVYRREFDNDQGLFSVEDLPAGIYDMAVRALPIDIRAPYISAKVQLKRIEIRRGYYYGEILARLVPDRNE